MVVSGAASGRSPDFKVARSSVKPDDAYFAGRKPATLRYLFRSGGEPRDLTISVLDVGTRRVVARWRRTDAVPGRRARRRWRGLDRHGGAARDGLYAFLIHAPGERVFPAGRFRLHGHRFPVHGPHGTRGPIGDFGAPRAGGRVHEGFDVTAACGTPLLALRAGRVGRRGYDPELYGNFVEINARDSKLRYFYAHMIAPARVAAGDRVATGERLGKVGLTGNAEGTPCHLHVEVRRAGRLVDPEPLVARWDRYG